MSEQPATVPRQTQHGVVFETDAAGRRSTSAVGRAVVCAALQPIDVTGARAAANETNWRTGYVAHFRRLVEAALHSAPDATRSARAGIDAVHQRMRVLDEDGEHPLAQWPSDGPEPATVTVAGHGAGGELVLPYRGTRLRGDDLRRRMDAWLAAGVLEPGAAEAVSTVLDNPDWLRLEGHTVAVLGAGAEMGPLPSLLRWGARVAAVDLPRPAIWQRLAELAGRSSGTLVMPTHAGTDRPTAAGCDLLAEVPSLTGWLAQQPGRVVVGNYVYADGAANVRVSVAVDELTRRLLAAREDTALAFLATPTDVFAVPGEAVAQSVANYEARSRAAKLLGRPLRTVTGGRLLRRQYVPGADPGVNDSLVVQQGPNYALAKRLQRWRALDARAAGATVSMNVAPPTRTRSVVKNRALAAAYAGAHRFGVEVFEPSTANVLMAVLLVHDLHAGRPRHEHPWQDEAFAAVHGGLWRTAYAPRSALGLAAVLGYGSARG